MSTLAQAARTEAVKSPSWSLRSKLVVLSSCVAVAASIAVWRWAAASSGLATPAHQDRTAQVARPSSPAVLAPISAARAVEAASAADSWNYGGGVQYRLDDKNGIRADYTRESFQRTDGGHADVWSVAYARRF